MNRLIQTTKLLPPRPLLLITATLISLPLVRWAIRDYRDFRSLGRGGIPQNPLGWLILIIFIRPFSLSKEDCLLVDDYPTEGYHEEIKALPKRKGGRAVVGGLVPHRQLSQLPGEHMRPLINALFTNAQDGNPTLLETKRSRYERHNDALFVRQDVLQQQRATLPQTAIQSRGEIAHVHDELSTHMFLHPADCRLMIEKGWCERHRLAVPANRIIPRPFRVGPTYVMMYAPRDEEELEVLRVVLRNGIRWMAGTENVVDFDWRGEGS